MGSYVNNHLIKDEQVVYETSYHWIIFFELTSILTLFIRPLILRGSDEFVVTNKRVIIKTGFISRDTIELNLNKVESIQVEQSVFGRMLGFGTLIVHGTGVTGQAFHKIADPLEFRRRLQEQYDQYTQSRGAFNG
jgi:uncharacterized membrane protein YdbT with pleckstrin-like domain